ncbi:MAG: NAD(P)-dependent alcohol dehydrogenase [Fimbriimonadaceae bacterium]|nr:NAD(P)-dependent alcohol dehydrogenase [Fimbriimonadaceae bacterium]QYK57427.1 MAG: NAD(P)-dependent alcohol dehydrogenase [Fimbriimonadaceae bacterium]
MPLSTAAYAVHSATTPLEPWSLDRREPGEKDVLIEIHYCGVCHTDIHFARNEWGFSEYPMVPGHEIVGRVVRVGGGVTKWKPGDSVGVGCMVDSCRACGPCKAGEEQYCDTGSTFTYNGREKDGSLTFGGYSTQIVVDQDFVVRIPDGLSLDAAAPLLCAGITTYSPLRHFGVKPGTRVGVVGLGGLGHMGVKFAKAMGAHTTVLSHSPSKEADARALGADDFIATKDDEAFKEHPARFDFLLNTVSAPHDLNAYVDKLTLDGRMVLVGLPDPTPLAAFPLILRRRSISGSLIGGIRETQEMLDFCAAHGIVCEIEVIPMQAINEAYERMLRSDVRYRFVIDMASLKA